jgi:hypothetical protein
MEWSASGIAELGRFFRGADFLDTPITSGAIAVPTGPGLGITPDIAALVQAFPYRPPWRIDAPPFLYRGAA